LKLKFENFEKKYWGSELSRGPNELGPKWVGAQMSRGPNELGPKCVGAQMSRGPNESGPKWVEAQMCWGPNESGAQMRNWPKCVLAVKIIHRFECRPIRKQYLKVWIHSYALKRQTKSFKQALYYKSLFWLITVGILLYCHKSDFHKVHIFWEGHKILQNLHRRFDCHYIE
jgi:hypothetical protein